ncbi:E3 ubiquitin-protein ligase TRAIP isoform X1 [Carcharodon carcharias]|uniref:E3 ubiquitin-protein ligase TRAIP isoform X1 n=1 Tax=Carcharodon carcharias TaxID=13397 RepID=UPI001B7E918A|nr:E3 ubiquitin-protein ligase TRAIP isoform X1 [Carcharodon carcharias]XP_041047842.1 E3 ubiquitin-protein ligase TRAIP isoform X1 [Carcharodon carcharias]
MPIRAYCTICSDYFDNFKDVAAIHCGHTFHNECLAQWFHSAPSRTCPQCRIKVSAKHIINKLFFDIGESEQVLDAETLQNDLDRAKSQLLQKEKEKKDRQSIIDKLRNTLDERNTRVESLLKELTETEMLCSTLKKQMQYLEQQQDDSKSAKEEAQRLRRKLKTLENIQVLLQSQRPEVEEMIQEMGIGQSAVEQLSIYCVSLKKEYENLKETFKSSIDMSEKLKREHFITTCKLEKSVSQLEKIKEELRASQEDVRNADKEIMNLKKKVEFLQKSLSTPNRTNEAISRLIFESPAPMDLQHPKLHKPTVGEDIDLSLTYDFDTPDRTPLTSVSTSSKKIKLDTAGLSRLNQPFKSLDKSKKTNKHEDDHIIPAFLKNSMLFQKKPCGGFLDPHRNQGSVRTGFDGLGGRTKFIEPTKLTEIRPLPLKAKRKKVSRPIVNASVRHQPKLENFLI